MVDVRVFGESLGEERDEGVPGGNVCGDVGVVLGGGFRRRVQISIDYCSSDGEEQIGCCKADARGAAFGCVC